MTCFRISQDFSSLLVDSNESDGVDEGKEDGGEADGALLAVDVDHAGVAFRSAVKLTDALDAETFRELQKTKYGTYGAPWDLFKTESEMKEPLAAAS